MISFVADRIISANERRLGVELDYVRHIAKTNFGLLTRYGKIFAWLDPRRHAKAEAIAVARLRAALALDCGTCVRAEINLARAAGMNKLTIANVLKGDFSALGTELSQVAALTDSVIADRADNPEARDAVRATYGEAALIEICYAMSGAAMLPTLKRGLGYATQCDLTGFRDLLEEAA